jgi:hypothetical protein
MAGINARGSGFSLLAKHFLYVPWLGVFWEMLHLFKNLPILSLGG